MTGRRVAILGAPSSAGAFAAGQELAPAALREAGLIRQLQQHSLLVEDHGDLDMRSWRPDRDRPDAQNAGDVVAVAGEVRDWVAATAGSDRVVLVLGGDCTTGIGTVAGLAAADHSFALVYFDLHADLNTTVSVATGALDWTGTAHMLGLEATVPELREIGPRTPLLTREQLVLFAHDSSKATAWELQTIEHLALLRIPVDDVASDPSAAARQALELVRGFDRVAVHFDLDVVDFTDAPLSENTGRGSGLTLSAALDALQALLSSSTVAAVTVAELNPVHANSDPECLNRFVGGLVGAFAGSSNHV